MGGVDAPVTNCPWPNHPNTSVLSRLCLGRDVWNSSQLHADVVEDRLCSWLRTIRGVGLAVALRNITSDHLAVWPMCGSKPV